MEPPTAPLSDPATPRFGTAVALPRRGGAARFLLRLFALSSIGALLLAVLAAVALVGLVSWEEDDGIHEHHHSLARSADQKVAIITLEGTILDGDGFVKKQIDHVRDDPSVKAVVLRVNSPGGTVSGSDYLYHHLQQLCRDRQLPLVVSMGGIAASGGYYVAMAVGDTPRTIFAEPTTWTGSIGVVIPHYNLAGLMEKWQIEEDSIKSHRLKQMGSPLRLMTEEERKIFQSLVDDGFTRFKEVVKSGRPMFRSDEAALDKMATGQVFTTRQALAGGLVDQEGFVEDAIDRALELAGLDKEHTSVVKYKHFGGIFDVVLGAHGQARGASPVGELAALFDLATPRAYYLCTWLPPLASHGE
jgi:protease IV